MRHLMEKCWKVETIMGIVLVSILIPVAIHAQELNTNLLKAVTRGDTVTVKKLLSKDVDVNSKEKYGRTALMIVSQEGHAKAAVRESNKNESDDTCSNKKTVEMRIKMRWEDIRHGKKDIAWLLRLLMDLLLMPGRIILWIIFSIGCWLGI